MKNKRISYGNCVLIVIIIVSMVLPVVGITSCGPSKGLISGLTLSSNYDAPTGTVTEKPGMIDDEKEVVQSKVDSTDFISIGNNLILSHKYTEALTAYDQALTVNPDNPDAWSGKMSALLYLEKYEDVLDLFSDAQKIIPHDYGIWINKGRAEYYLHEYQKAIKSADESLKIKTDNIDALILKADCLSFNPSSAADLETALEITDYILSKYPNNEDIWYARGNVYYSNEEYKKAFEAFEKDLKNYPDRICSHFYIVKMLIDEGKSDEAMLALSRMTDSFPTKGNDVFDPTGEVFALIKFIIKETPDIELTDTLPYWEWAFSHTNEPESRWSSVNSALTHYISGDIGSLDSINSLIEPLLLISGSISDQERDDIISLYAQFINNIFKISNRSLETIEATDKVLSLDPENKSGYNEFVLYRKAFTQYHNLGQYDNALITIDEALRFNPNDDYNWNFKGDILKSLGRIDEAKEAYNTAQIIKDSTSKNDEIEYVTDNDTDLSALIEDNTSSTLSHQTTGGLIDGTLLSVAEINRYQSVDEYLEAMEAAYNSDDMELMVDLTEEAIELYPDNDRFWSIKGAGLNNLERYDEAIEAADKAISLDRSNAHAWFVKGYALEKLGKYDDAEIYYEKSLELDPDDEDYLEGLDRLRGLMDSS